jgi:hypothetical protein
LTVLDHLGVKKRIRRFKCICDCGTITDSSYPSLISGHTESCGCLKIERLIEGVKKRKLPVGEAGLNHLYTEYRTKNAEKRDLYFNLTKEQFKTITKGNCYYCGDAPYKNCQGYIYNGIDNTKGYDITNTVSCCYKCNCAKACLTQKEFYMWVEKMYMKLKQKGHI